MKNLITMRSPLFFRYFFSYMIIFLVPFITVSGIFYHKSVTSLRDEIVHSNVFKLEQIKEMTDSQINQLREIAIRISFDYRLTPYMVRAPYTDKQAIEELKRYKENNSIVDDIILYYFGDEQVYSPSGSGSMNILIGNILSLNNEEYVKFEHELNALSSRSSLFYNSKKNQEKTIAYLFQIPVNSATAHGAVMFFVKEATITKLIKNILGNFNGDVYIFNDRNDILASNSQGSPIQLEDAVKLASGKPGISEKQINNQHFSIVTVQSDTSGWTFVTALPTAQFYSKVADLQFFMFLILILISFIGLGMAIILTIRQYRPIHSLSRYLGQVKQQEPADQYQKDELTRIRDSVELLFKDSEKLRSQVNMQQPFVRDQCLIKLLRGDKASWKETKELLNQLKIPNSNRYFFVAIISFHKGFNEQEVLQEKTLQFLEKLSFRDGEGYGLQLFDGNDIVLIVSMNKEIKDTRKSKHTFLEKLAKKLQDLYDVEALIGVGTIYEEINQINRSFIEATAATEYTFLKEYGRIIYYDRIVRQEENVSLFPEIEKIKFTQSLKQGDVEVSSEGFTGIINGLLEKDLPIHILKCIYFDIINTIFKTVSELGMSNYIYDMRELVEFRSIQALEGRIRALIPDICNKVKQKKQSHNTTLRDKVLDYIDDHYKLNDLSLEKTAEAFQLSSSYLSRFIKEQTGTTFTQLVWQLRLEEAKRQLESTDHSVNSIVKDLGYVDVAYFIRKFRETEGLTPGQFRKQIGIKN